jgi:hypothetical protein
MLQAIEQAVKLHDKYQIEIKLDYELLEGKKTCYQVSTYIFIPQNLGVNPYTYTKADFYRDIQSYIRLKTPTLILRDFTEHPASPLIAIEKIVSIENWTNSPEYQARLINSLKLLSAMFKSSIREHFNLIQKRINEAPPGSKIYPLIYNLIEEFLSESQKIADKYRGLYPSFNLPNVAGSLFTAYTLTDESLSLLIEEHAAEMFQIIETHLKSARHKTDFKHRLNERVQAEIKYRKSHGYHSILTPGHDNEEYSFRASVLKKYASSVLYLSTAIRREGKELEQILFALAAGISMIFATVVAFYFQQYYGNFTFPFFIALVVGYMFKDRIKELGRSWFAKYLQNILYDRRTIIRTQDGQHKLGILREKMAFITEKDIPGAIIKARNRDLITELDNDGYGEHVICYTKEITLFTTAFRIFANAPEITGINDITRYDIRAYLKRMDEPVQEKNYLVAGQLSQISSHKVYHLNFITRYKSILPQKEKTYKRVRLILNQAGIKRIEHVTV